MKSSLHPTRHWFLLSMLVVALAFSVSSCTFSVTVSKPGSGAMTTHSNEASYRATWTRDWTSLVNASAPWNPVKGAPGACDKGGDGNVCYRTDQAVLPLLTTLLHDLQTVTVPPQYAKANGAMLSAINLEGQGLADRDFGISHNDNASFSHAYNELHAAGPQLWAAYNEFPSGDRPAPAEFGSGRYSS